MTGEPEWGDFKILLALARGGSVAGAARELRIDGSTVSRRLTALEEAIGVRLIVRGGRELGWTAEGRSALSAAEAMESAVNGAVQSCREAQLDAAGSVRISMPPGIVPVALSQMVPLVREKQPSLKLDISADLRRVDLVKGEADIAVRMARPTETDLVARRAFDLGWFVYAAAPYLERRGTPTSTAELGNHHLVLYDDSLHMVAPLRWLDQHAGSDFVRVDNLEMASQLLAAGTGIGVLPAVFEVQLPALLRIFPKPVASLTGWVVYHESAREKARVRAAVDALIEFFDSHNPLFSGQPRQ